MKKYWLYRQPLVAVVQNNKGVWWFDDQFDTREQAEAQMKENAERASWKVWKIEEVYIF